MGLRFIFPAAVAAACAAVDAGAQLRTAPAASPTLLDVTTGEQVFPERQARFGSFSSREHCATVPNGLWIHPEEEKTGECIRYYAAGAKPGASRELVLFFSGDDLNRDRSLGSPENYARLTPKRMQADVERTGKALGAPFVWVARPGVRGSSGDQLLKTRFREMRLMNGAVSRLREMYGVATFHAYGQSGGGAVLAALLNLRTDIGCAALASANLDVDQWLSEQSGDRRGGATDWYNPKTYINANTLRARIVILSDPRDKAVSYGSQRSYARALEKAGGQSVHVVAAGGGPLFHSLAGEGVRALRRCIKGAPLETIKAELDQPALRALVPAEPAPTPPAPGK
jgi:pimeloyl-ACP methyl ester carboxylesterase